MKDRAKYERMAQVDMEEGIIPGYIFTVRLNGIGDSPDEAWQDATEAFALDPGSTPGSEDRERQ
jgi:hypothetical protein